MDQRHSQAEIKAVESKVRGRLKDDPSAAVSPLQLDGNEWDTVLAALQTYAGPPVRQREGYRQVWMPESTYQEFMRAKPGVRKQRPRGDTGGCGVVITTGPDPGSGWSYQCLGSCGFVDRVFLGRHCHIQHGPGEGGTMEHWCECTGGWGRS